MVDFYRSSSTVWDLKSYHILDGVPTALHSQLKKFN